MKEESTTKVANENRIVGLIENWLQVFIQGLKLVVMNKEDLLQENQYSIYLQATHV